MKPNAKRRKKMANYYCKYCGDSFPSIANMTAGHCIRHPSGPNKGRHSPAL